MKRSNSQNSYYWGVVVPEATAHYQDNLGALIKDVLLAVRAEPSEEFVHELFKMMFLKGGSTTKLDTAEFEDFALQIRARFDMEHQHYIPFPNEVDYEL